MVTGTHPPLCFPIFCRHEKTWDIPRGQEWQRHHCSGRSFRGGSRILVRKANPCPAKYPLFRHDFVSMSYCGGLKPPLPPRPPPLNCGICLRMFLFSENRHKHKDFSALQTHITTQSAWKGLFLNRSKTHPVSVKKQSCVTGSDLTVAARTTKRELLCACSLPLQCICFVARIRFATDWRRLVPVRFPFQSVAPVQNSWYDISMRTECF